MYRGTTPTLNITLNIEVSTIKELYISFSQYGVVLIEKTLDDCTILGEKELTITLTQEETLKLRDDCKVKSQIRAILNSGEVAASDIKESSVNAILKDGVI